MNKLAAGRASPDPALKAAIIAAARELFVEYGFSRIQMDDVARKLAISKKTLYLHFRSKENLEVMKWFVMFQLSVQAFF